MSQRKLSSFEDRLARLKDAQPSATPAPAPAAPPAPPASRLARIKAPPLLPDQPPKAAATAAPRLPLARVVFVVGLGLLVGGGLMLSRDGLSLPALSVDLGGMLSGPTVAQPVAALANPVAAPDTGTLEVPVLPGLTLSAAPVIVAVTQVVAVPDATPVAAAPVPPEPPPVARPGLFDRLTAMITGAPAEPPPPLTMPVDFLPPAPAGWLRVTETEASDPGLLDRLQADWALIADALPLEQNKGVGLLEQMLAAPPAPAEQLQVRAQALYLAGNGEYLSVTLKFRPARAAFGTPGDDMAWRQTLRAEVKRDAGTTEAVEALTLAGIAMFNRTRPDGKSRISRPVGKDFTVPNGLKLTAALTHRAEVQANGHTTPDAAGALIAAFDRKALGALLE